MRTATEGPIMEALFPDDRVLCLAGTENFREVGGYPTEDGRRLRRGLIWRSARLDALKQEDAEMLNTLGIRLVADLRRASERAESSPDRIWPGENVRVVWWEDLSATAPSVLADLEHGHGDVEVYRAVICRHYELMAEAHGHRLRDQPGLHRCCARLGQLNVAIGFADIVSVTSDLGTEPRLGGE